MVIMKTRIKTYALAILALAGLVSCEKVSPIGVLVSGTAVEDRVEMSHSYYSTYKGDYREHLAPSGEYSFLVGADSHLTSDLGRMQEMLQIGLDHDDLMYCHLGDIADTKAEYYINLGTLIDEYKWRYAKKYYKEIYVGEEDGEWEREDRSNYIYEDTVNNNIYSVDDIPFPFYPVVGNHDITHNGWALWSNLFHSSFYDVYVTVGEEQNIVDHFIFLDTASGTLGKKQVELIEEDALFSKELEEFGLKMRHTFVFTHTNLFRPSSMQFASTFAREETFFLLKQFEKWNVHTVFYGHVHKWDERDYAGVKHITLDSMSERNSPGPGDYLLRVHVKADGTVSYEKVRMNYVAP